MAGFVDFSGLQAPPDVTVAGQRLLDYFVAAGRETVEVAEVSEVPLYAELIQNPVLPAEADPVVNCLSYSHAAYGRLAAKMRLGTTSFMEREGPDVTGGTVNTAGTASDGRIYTRWEDGKGVVRTRIHARGNQATRAERDIIHPTKWSKFFHGTWRGRQVLPPAGYRYYEDRGSTRTKTPRLVWNFYRNSRYIPLAVATKDALVAHTMKDSSQFLQLLCTRHVAITRELLQFINRGLIFTLEMVEHMVQEAVNSNLAARRFSIDLANAAADVVAHYLVNQGTVIGRSMNLLHRKWKTNFSPTSELYQSLVGDPLDADLFLALARIAFQSNSRIETLAQAIDCAALTYGIAFAGARRAAPQKDIDSAKHIQRIIMGITVAFAALSFATGVIPIPLLQSGINVFLGPIEEALKNHVRSKVSDGACQRAVDEVRKGQFETPAVEGKGIPSLYPVNDDSLLAWGHPIGDKRRELGEAFVTNPRWYNALLTPGVELPVPRPEPPEC